LGYSDSKTARKSEWITYSIHDLGAGSEEIIVFRRIEKQAGESLYNFSGQFIIPGCKTDRIGALWLVLTNKNPT